MAATYLVDVGKRQPVMITAEDPKDAAFQALMVSAPPASGVITVMSREADGETQRERLNVADRRCRVCGCTEERACRGGCCWMGWDLCSACVFE